MGTGRPWWALHHGHHSALDDQPSCPLLSGNLSEPHCCRLFGGVILSVFFFLCWRGIDVLQFETSFHFTDCVLKVLQLIQAYMRTAVYTEPVMLNNDHYVSGLTLKWIWEEVNPRDKLTWLGWYSPKWEERKGSLCVCECMCTTPECVRYDKQLDWTLLICLVLKDFQ